MNTHFPQELTGQSDEGCGHCRIDLDFEFTFAYQPIVDVRAGSVYGYEALVRGPGETSAANVLARVTDANRYAFDQACRTGAIRLAHALGLTSRLSINFLPNAVYRPELCIRSTLAAASEAGFPSERIMFEITESEEVTDPEHLTGIINDYQSRGFITALDDFGSGHAGLNLLARFQPDLIKLDMGLVRDIHENRRRQVIAEGLLTICRELGITVLAEGIEYPEEAAWFAERGVALMQGYYFARPGYETLPEPRLTL